MNARLAKVLLWSIGIIVSITIIAVAFVPDFDVRIPEKTVRNAISERIPQTYGDPNGIEAYIASAEIDFLEEGEKGMVRLETDVDLSGFGLKGSGSAKTTTGVRYANGAFYLSDLTLDDFELKPSLGTRAKLLAWKKVLDTFLDEAAADIRTREGEAAFSEFETRRRMFGPIVLEAIDERLGTIPVYRLEGGPAQYAIFLALKDVYFTETEVVATLSAAQAILKISTGLTVLLCLALLAWSKYADVRAPDDKAY
ncbi:MAG: hypothetical protein HKN27_14355 [Silicimonas sp.]|nr:hypothetical protein [Silicimonas sp.]